MANPPYSVGVILLSENEDGFNAVVFHWADISDGTPCPPSPSGLETTLKQANPTFARRRNCSTRNDLIAKLSSYINSQFPDTPAS